MAWIQRTDGRHKLGKMFKYIIHFDRNDFKSFCMLRNELWETHGPAVEMDGVHSAKDFMPISSMKWSWDTDEHLWNLRIFIRDDEFIAFLMLKYGEPRKQK